MEGTVEVAHLKNLLVISNHIQIDQLAVFFHWACTHVPSAANANKITLVFRVSVALTVVQLLRDVCFVMYLIEK